MNEVAFSTYHEIVVSELRVTLRRYFKIWGEGLEKEVAERQRWISTIEQPRLTLVVLSAVLLECSINFYLCTKCNSKRFAQIERDRKIGSLFGKWTEAPKEFVPHYRLPKSSELGVDLRKLIDRRKAIVHSKPMISIDGDNRHRGNEPEVTWDEHDFIGRSVSLPVRLIDHVLEFDPDAHIPLTSLRMYAGVVAGEFHRGQVRIRAPFLTPNATST